MKIAILADIHGNKRGLETVADHIENWGADQVIVNGDVVNRGPSNAECWDFVWQRHITRDWKLVRGNHEDFVLNFYDPRPLKSEKEAGMNQFAVWAWNQVKDQALEMASMPDRQTIVAPDGSMLFVTHGTVGSNRVGVFPDSTEKDLRRLTSPGPAMFVTAHTHRPLIRKFNQTTVVNVGSAGLPFDGDPRASYGQITWTKTAGWQAEIIRLDYDREAAQMDLVTSGFLDEGGPFAKLVLVEYRLAIGMIQRWIRLHQEEYLRGETDLD
ncbi:MAG: putative phosphodiesterase, partial [Candidatus Promineifilaceae bacterium]